ncbi:MAG: GNAT family N-acetyltransferase [Actinobacteria bacterium]|nr:GNAT family N-acetyltransferase [Actinomycetota bacterium]
MTVEYRPIAPEEFPEFARADMLAFGADMRAGDVELEGEALEFDRTVAALDEGRFVGGTAVLSLDVGLPGGRTMPAGGLTWTGVIPTHRRQGILSAMMARQLEGSRERAESVSILQASQSTIYGRFGYGAATYSLGFSLSTPHAAFRAAAPRSQGGLVALDKAAAQETLPPVFERFRHARPGSVGRSAGLWKTYLGDPEHHREGASGYFHAAHRDSAGQIDGYVTYRVTNDRSGDIPQDTLTVQELMARDPQAHAALWRYCLDMDLAATVTTSDSPVDEPLRWLLTDSRRFRVSQINDSLYLRVLDVATALAARAYHLAPRDNALVFHIEDRFLPDLAGDYLLEAGPDGAECARTTRAADLSLDIADLGEVYLGGVSFATLAWSGRVIEHTAGAAARADALFRTERAPWCSTHF